MCSVDEHISARDGQRGDFMTELNNEYYVVHKDILPTAIIKTIEVKKLLKSGEMDKINEAVEEIGLSRSAYYKYRDRVFPFLKDEQQKIITLSLLLKHESGVLSKVINKIAEVKGNVLTINQGIPLDGIANATVTIETLKMRIDVNELVDKMEEVSGIQKIEVIARNFRY
jgi:chorismate mutase